MSFQYVPSLFRIPEVPNFTPPNGIWRGKGKDEGYFALNGEYAWGGNIIVRDPNFCYQLQVDGEYAMTPVFSDINGYVYWEGSGYVYYTQTYGWVYCNKFPGYEPFEDYEYNYEDKEYIWKGDEFYTFSSPPYGPDNEVKMEPRGSIHKSGKEKTLKAVWPRWVAKNGEFGVYEGKDGESGQRIKGLPRFKGNGEYFVRSLNKEKGYYTYGRIHYAGGKWVIGEISSAGGWHEGSEPKPDGSVNFKFTKPEGSEAEGKDISVSLDSYICGEETEAAFLGSAAIWR